MDGDAYHALRDASETELRRRNGWAGDLDLFEICEEISRKLPFDIDARMLAETEFNLDFSRIQPKLEMVEILNACLREGKKFLIVSDTYYTESQIRKILMYIGVHSGYNLYVSSNLKKRKDRGDLWDFIKQELLNEKYNLKDLVNQFLHIGDNVCADAQNVGDRGMGFFHILNPIDKYHFFNRASKLEKNNKYWNYYGPLISSFGRNPFI